MNLNYHLLDVFTNQAFGGNQVAVFTDAPADISQATMQKIAKEMNLAVSKSKPIVELNPQAPPSILLRQLAQQMVKV